MTAIDPATEIYLGLPGYVYMWIILGAGLSLFVYIIFCWKRTFCLIHFEDAIKTGGLENEMKVIDLMELFISIIVEES